MMLVKGGAFELPHSVRFQLRPDGIRPLAGGLSEPLESWRGRSVDAVCGNRQSGRVHRDADLSGPASANTCVS